MIKDIISLILKDIIFLIKENPEFFQEAKSSREKTLNKYKAFPKSVSSYLISVDESKVLEDIKSIVNLISGNEVVKSDAIEAIIDYLTTDFIVSVDTYYADKSVEKLYLGSELPSYFENTTEQEVISEIYNLVRDHREIPLIVVQLSAEANDKSSIRKHFSKEFPSSVVEFQRNSDLLGGIKIFVNGEVKDYSWLSKVKSLELVAI